MFSNNNVYRVLLKLVICTLKIQIIPKKKKIRFLFQIYDVLLNFLFFK